MTILPAKRSNTSSNEEPEENSQGNQQIQLGLNLSSSRLNHNNIPLSLNLSQSQLSAAHSLLLNQESGSCHELWSRSTRDELHTHSHPLHSPHAAFDDGPSCSKRRKYSALPVKERYYRTQERKQRLRERGEKQERDRSHAHTLTHRSVREERERERERELERSCTEMEKCERQCGELLSGSAAGNSSGGVERDMSGAGPSGGSRLGGEDASGYNSEDEYIEHPSAKLTEEEWRQRDLIFARSLEKRGFVIKPMVEDGACLFRAIADQVYGDQEMHSVVRTHCMDYILKNRDFYCAYITEDFNKYVSRKRHDFVHGNHLEIQALSEMYHRSIEVYCYQLKPINIFHGVQKSDYEPIRLSYQRASHYNSITNPFNPSVGVGLGLPSYVLPAEIDRRQLNDAVRQSEELLIEQTMMEDKLKATDWEATNEVIEEQVARESYLQWCKDNERRRKQQQAHSTGHSQAAASSSTITSAMVGNRSGSNSPRSSPHSTTHPGSPKCAARSPATGAGQSFVPRVSASPLNGTAQPSAHQAHFGKGGEGDGCGSGSSKGEDCPEKNNWETESIFSRLPPEVFGVHEWEDAGLMARVLAASQQEYLDSLKARSHQPSSPCSSPPVPLPGPSTR